MTQSSMTLGDFFFRDADAQVELGWTMEENPFSDLSQTVSSVLKPHMVAKSVASTLLEALDVGIDKILLSAWSHYESLRETLDRSRASPDESILLPLTEHSVESSHHPSVEIIWDGSTVATVKFDVNIALDVQGAVLRIQNGQILEVLGGSCEGNGQIKYQNATLVEGSSRKFELPAAIRIGERGSLDLPDARTAGTRAAMDSGRLR